jgi:ribonuclease HII
VAAAVILRPGVAIPGLADSKLLSPAQRRRLIPLILAACECWGIGAVAPRGIDRWNIRRASFRAMRRAVERLSARPDHVIVDGFRIPRFGFPQTALIKGDRLCRSVAAASVLAKVARDRRMDRYHIQYPHYGWNANRGYPTPEHLRALERHGPSPLHRRTFAPVRNLLESPQRIPF